MTGTLELDYLEIPVIGKVTIPVRNSAVRPILFAGPEIAFEVACSLNARSGGVSLSAGCDEVGVELKNVDFGLLAGGGIEIGHGPLAVTLEGRYSYGLVDIDEANDSSTKSRVFSVIAGLSFRLPR